MFVVRRAVLIIQADWDKKDEPEPKEGGGDEEEENPEEQVEENGNEGPRELSDDELERRINDLTESITLSAWDYLRRGLFDKHKVVIISILCFRIKVKKGLIPMDQYNCLISNKIAEPGVPQPQQLKFMQEINWLMIRGLEGSLQSDLTKNMTNVSVEWSKWYEKPNPESGGFPKQVNEKSDFEKLLFLRALRQDRMEQALKNYVQSEMDSEQTKRRGVGYCDKPPFSMSQAMLESDCSIPFFFVLFPGVEPTKDIREAGVKYNKSISNNTLIEISMGQGQEDRANKALVQAAQDGNWVALNNIHLMTTWTRILELKLDEVTPTAHEEFRCFLSSEAPPLPYMQIVPESILQNALKVSNEAPQDVKSNMLRAYGLFNQARLEECTKKTEQKAILFGLCTFHSFILARKKFGAQGWSRMQSFNDGDLTICGDILRNYLNRYDLIPWDDLRQLFGEIMYGGHITDFWDRRTNNAQLRVLIKPELMERQVISANFTAPDPNKTEYDDYIKQVNEKIPGESPELIKINNLAEVGYLTNVSNFIFETILNLSGSGAGAGKTEKIEDTIATYLGNPGLKSIDTQAIRSRKDITPQPFDIVLVQECEQVNVLIDIIKSSLEDLLKGCRGELGVTDTMEKLQLSLMTGKVPAIWQKQGYDTAKALMAWYGDLLMRIDHQQKWGDIIQPNPQFALPQCVWLAGFFNPLKFLTACTQVVARQKGLALDGMSISTVVTEFNSVEEAKLEENECALVYGMVLEGADWEQKAERGEGYLKVQETKKIHPDLPVVEIRPVNLKEKLEKYTRGQYECPVFKTGGRGATFVWAANLKMRDDNEPEDFWTLCSTCLLLADD